MIYKSIDIDEIDRETFEKYWELLSGYKKKKMSQLNKPEDRMLTFAGEMLARQCLSELTGAPEFAFEILADENGKCVVGNFNAEFNISHSGTKAVCAADKVPLGIDIEKIRPFSFGVAQRICTPGELLYVFSGSRDSFIGFSSTAKCEEKQAQNNFYRIWTLKEAYFKATGRGIRDDMKTVEFSFSENAVTVSDKDYKVIKNDIIYGGAYALSVIVKDEKAYE